MKKSGRIITGIVMGLFLTTMLFTLASCGSDGGSGSREPNVKMFTLP